MKNINKKQIIELNMQQKNETITEHNDYKEYKAYLILEMECVEWIKRESNVFILR